MVLRIALAQMNPIVGDFMGNSDKIFEAARIAHEKGAHVLLTPELALVGYPPEDLLLRPDFYRQSALALEALARRLKVFEGLHVIVGHPHCTSVGAAEEPLAVRSLENPPLDMFNSASQLVGGRIVGRYDKKILPTTQVFDEYRYFARGEASYVFDLQGVRCALLICEDAWSVEPMLEARAQGAQLMLVLNGSPWHRGKMALRLERMRAILQQAGPLGLVYLNLVGGQDELVFDGGSFALDASGTLAMQWPQFEEVIGCVDCEVHTGEIGAIALDAVCGQVARAPYLTLHGACYALGADEAQTYQALVLGVRDYMHKNGFTEALIGLSGGVDSALTLVIACDALGAERVHAVMMPSVYTAQISLEDARTLAQNLGVRYTELPINPVFEACGVALSPAFADARSGMAQAVATSLTLENLQARIRGMFLMALANQSNAVVLTTGNKSEMAVGYCTLYGDMAGGFAVLKDVFKTTVYALCHYRNAIEKEKKPEKEAPLIPSRILTRAPSAELRDNQTDQDTLPAYATLDAIVHAVMEEHAGKKELMAAGYASHDIDHVLSLLWRSEYKRYQAPPGPRVTRRGFGRDWRYPLTKMRQE